MSIEDVVQATSQCEASRQRPTIGAFDVTSLWHGYDRSLQGLIERYRSRDVCDVGGGRKPALAANEVTRLGVDYALLDISGDELAAAPEWCDKIEADIAAPNLAIDRRFDFVFSRMLAEHVKDGRRFHTNIFHLLQPGGIAFHFFPTMFTVPFVVNKVLPEDIARRLLQRAQPRGALKFPAHYSWTWGPTSRQIRRLEEVGFEVLVYLAGFGHHYYRRVPPLQRTMETVWEHARARELYHFASYAYLVVRRPHASAEVAQSGSPPAT